MGNFQKSPAPPQALRALYLDSLPEPQGLFMETQVAYGTTWQAKDEAYAVIREDRLVELFVIESQRHRLISLFDEIMEISGASIVFCKSFDRLLLHAALSRPAQVSTFSFMFRRIVDADFQPILGLSFRMGTAADAQAILAFDDGFFHGPEEIADYANCGELVLLESTDGILGCGIAKPVIPGRPDMDIGMLVAPNHRRKGYGTHIISFLKDYCLQRGQRPICGCGADNIASQRTLT